MNNFFKRNKSAMTGLSFLFSLTAIILFIAIAYGLLEFAKGIYLNILNPNKNNDKQIICKKSAGMTLKKDDGKSNSAHLKLRKNTYSAFLNFKYALEINRNERQTVKLLNKYAAAQKVYYEHYGYYAPNAKELIVEENHTLKIIDPDLSVINFSIQGNIAISGYYFFCGDISIKDGASSLPNNFVLCAAPEQYRLSGLHTFYVDSRQIVYRKDIQGKTITRLPLLSDYSWKAVSVKSSRKNKP